jgi:hypothetical protein
MAMLLWLLVTDQTPRLREASAGLLNGQEEGMNQETWLRKRFKRDGAEARIDFVCDEQYGSGCGVGRISCDVE